MKTNNKGNNENTKGIYSISIESIKIKDENIHKAKKIPI